MRKTSVYLDIEEATRLAFLARREGQSQAEIIRRAIREFKPEQHGDRDFRIAGIADGPGGSIADVSDEELLEGFGS